MGKKLYAYGLTLANRMTKAVKNDRGAQAIEYVGLAALVVVLLVAIMGFVKDSGGETIGKKIIDKLGKMLDSF
ncbi:hypothetical protein [Gorillibacterium sp. sgz500922]|uniref:hypothetical protein n=1 Tax=Gorillibacterium sp. sgz500922 TaxID=3446694 RepID=UPI003F6808E6